jgi:hypothetical protein
MTRPARTDVEHGEQSWDTDIDDNLKAILDGPFPIKEYADFASLPAAAAYDRCLAVTISPPMVWISDGAAWRPTGMNCKVSTSGAMVGATVTIANAFPAGVRQIGVAGRVTTLITASGGGATMNVGDHGGADPDRYATGVAFAAGTTWADAATADPGGWNAAARDVVLAPDVGAFTAGVVKIYAFYLSTFAPTS